MSALPQPQLKVIDYIIVWQTTAELLSLAVQEKLKDGFTPLGGVAAVEVIGLSRLQFAQAMVKYEDIDALIAARRKAMENS